MNNSYKEKTGSLPNNFIVLGILLILISISLVCIFGHLWQIILSIILTLAGILLLMIKTGFVVDFNSKKIRYYWGFFGFIFGKWDSLKDVKYISIVRIKLNEAFSEKECQITFIEYKYRVNFIFENKRHNQVLKDNLPVAMEKAMIIAKGLGLKIFDNSEGKKVWISP
ncbi:MAG: hypothetical protein ABIJ97_00685 [Bacteroidota bacterium]